MAGNSYLYGSNSLVEQPMRKEDNESACEQMQAPNLNLAAPERVEPPPTLNLSPPTAIVEPEDRTEPVSP